MVRIHSFCSGTPSDSPHDPSPSEHRPFSQSLLSAGAGYCNPLACVFPSCLSEGYACLGVAPAMVSLLWVTIEPPRLKQPAEKSSIYKWESGLSVVVVRQSGMEQYFSLGSLGV